MMHNVTKHSTILVTSFLITAVLNYAFGVALSWFFSPAQFGVLGVAQSLLLLTALVVGSGFAWTAARDVAASGVTDGVRRRFRAAWTANVALGLLLAGGLWAAYATGWLPLGQAYRTIVPLVGLTTVLLAARSVVNGAARGLYRFGPVAVNLAGEVVVKVAGGLALVAVGAGAAGVMIGFAVGAAAALTHSLWIARSARLWRGQGWFDRRVVIATAPLFVGMLGPALMLNLDILGLKFLTPPGQGDELAGLYQAAVILARTPVFIAQSLTLVLFSYAAGTKAPSLTRNPQFAIRNPYTRAAVRAWVVLLLPAGLTLILAPYAALSLFFPAHYQAAGPALRVAAGGGVLLALVTLLNGVSQARGDRRRPAVAAGLATITQVAALVWLVPQWGALGAAWSLLAAGSVALIGLASAFAPRFGRPATNDQRPTTNDQQLLSFIRLSSFVLRRPFGPLLALAAPLLLLPDEGCGAAVLKLGLAGLGYLAALAGTRLRPIGSPDRPTAQPVQPVHTRSDGRMTTRTMIKTQTRIAAIIPSLNGNTAEQRRDLAAQTWPPDEVRVIQDVRPVGQARQQGVAATEGDVLLFIDDDARLGQVDLVERLVRPLLEDPSIGVTGVARVLPPGASWFQRRVATEIPRTVNAVPRAPLETNPPLAGYGHSLITTTCCAIRRTVYEEAGGFCENLVTGEDTDLFYRVRRLGYRFLLIPDAWVEHPAPGNLPDLLRKYYWYGIGYGQEARRRPEQGIGPRLPTSLRQIAFLLAATLWVVPNTFILYSYGYPHWDLGFRPLKALSTYAVAWGYVKGWRK